MQSKYLHEIAEFPELLQILSKDMGILAGLIEKDYWIMHVLYGLKKQGFSFEMKGGTSLSKGNWILRTIVYHLFQRIVYQCFSPKFTSKFCS